MVIIHEFGHGYWYGLSASNEFEEAWLDEGINTYSTGKVLAKAYGAGSLPLTLAGIPLTRYSGAFKYADLEPDRAAAIHAVTSDPVVTVSWRFYLAMSYALNVYMRAATCLRTLENFIGKEAMLRVMRAFHTRFRFRHPTTRDFIATASEISGRDLDWFFDELFFGTEEWDYAVDPVISREIKAARGIFDRQGKKSEVTARAARELDRKDKNPPLPVLGPGPAPGRSAARPRRHAQGPDRVRGRHAARSITGTARAAGPSSATRAPARSSTPRSTPTPYS